MRLLICDDHALFASSLALALRDLGHEVAAITDTAERAVDRVNALRPMACLVDLGLGTGPSGGLEVASAIRRCEPGTVIVLLSGTSDAATIWHAVDSGLVDAAVAKQCDLPTLDRILNLAAAGARPVVHGWHRPSATAVRHSTQVRLTDREREVLQLLVDGMSTRSIAAQLGVSANTARTHVASVLQKLQVHERGKAAKLALDLGLVANGPPLARFRS